jgi:hypothetical protein
MLAFVIPLRNRLSNEDWSLASALARRTLRSILAQTSRDFHVFLVCRDKPDACPADDQLTIVQRDFPNPDAYDAAAPMLDKSTKVRVGLVAARAVAPCHVMLCDADDCVSGRLAAYVAKYPECDGWYFERGWMHDEHSRLIFNRCRDFDAICGTSAIVRVTPADLPTSETDNNDDEKCVVLSGHHRVRSESMRRGKPLLPLPFAGAVYVVGTGINDSGFSLRGWRSKKVLLQKCLNYRPLTQNIRREFGLSQLE